MTKKPLVVAMAMVFSTTAFAQENQTVTEFDEVLVPFASFENYQTEVDRSLLYIACTRAMHHLTLTHTNTKPI